MTNQEILTKAIEKAIASGWRSNRSATMLASSITTDGAYDQLEPLVFSHEFAKALWGAEIIINTKTVINLAEPYKPDNRFDTTIPAWQYHLQQMVIAPDPIKYLGEHLGTAD